MKGILTLFFVLFSALVATNNHDLSDHEKSLVNRFQEHIVNYQKNKPANDKEALISTRARLLVAEKQLSHYKNNESEDSKPSPQKLKAAQARIDHYKRQIKLLEVKIINKRTRKRIKP